MDVKVELVNAFTADGEGGNPAGVVLEADALTDAQKLKVAQAVGFSETAFVSRDHEADVAVSFFTVTDEVDFCGHATLATFSVLHRSGTLTPGHYRQRTKAGILGVEIQADGSILMEQQLPDVQREFARDDIAALLGLTTGQCSVGTLPVVMISTGLPDILVPVQLGSLDSIAPDFAAMSEFCRRHNAVGVHAFELNPAHQAVSASCRNFAPLFGIDEESATGSASGALASYLATYLDTGDNFVFEQGRVMGCRSLIHAQAKISKQGISSVKVGGVAQQTGSIIVSV